MSKEVTAYMANLAIEGGAFFGCDPDELRAHFKDQEALSHRWKRVDWEDYLALMKQIFEKIGHGEDLVPRGQEYLRECFKFRNVHLYAQFRSWERCLWVSKHFVTKRMMQGYEIDYEVLEPNFFHITQKLDESREGSEDLLYYLTGVWTGSSRLADLHHEIYDLKVGPHLASANIRFDQRSKGSLIVHNTWYSRLKTYRHLKQDRAEQQKLLQALKIETQNVETALNAVSDAVLAGVGDEIHESNQIAKTLIAHPDFCLTTCLREKGITLGEKNLRLRSCIPLDHGDRPGWMITLENQTSLLQLEQQIQEAPLQVRQGVHKDLELTLGKELLDLEQALLIISDSFAEDTAGPLLQNLLTLCRQCQKQSQALVDHHLPDFVSDSDLIQALRELAEEYQTVFHFSVRIETDALPTFPSAEVRADIFLLIREAVRNAYRHSGGTEVLVRMTPDFIILHDNGKGLLEKADQSGGLGCDSIRSRAQRVGATARIEAAPLNGWSIELWKKEQV
jgi:hypothetical protein